MPMVLICTNDRLAARCGFSARLDQSSPALRGLGRSRSSASLFGSFREGKSEKQLPVLVADFEGKACQDWAAAEQTLDQDFLGRSHGVVLGGRQAIQLPLEIFRQTAVIVSEKKKYLACLLRLVGYVVASGLRNSVGFVQDSTVRF
ncbi:hypothetical protein NKI79_11560 [Mesorhizobium sp. M0340]|uniref:hypothetical protein n=1 Tax=Mesorhizobium sp. M0340 TaxID=2956939 RepID=UPI00333A17B8